MLLPHRTLEQLEAAWLTIDEASPSCTSGMSISWDASRRQRAVRTAANRRAHVSPPVAGLCACMRVPLIGCGSAIRLASVSTPASPGGMVIVHEASHKLNAEPTSTLLALKAAMRRSYRWGLVCAIAVGACRREAPLGSIVHFLVHDRHDGRGKDTGAPRPGSRGSPL